MAQPDDDDPAQDEDTGIWSTVGELRARHEARAKELRELYGLYPATENHFSDRPLTFDEAITVMNARYERPLDESRSHYSRASIRKRSLQHRDWWYLGVGWIGCSGHIVHRVKRTVDRMGSIKELGDCFWAYSRGISFARSDFTVTACALRGRELESLANELGVDAAVLADMRDPIRLRGVWLWYAIPRLREWSESGALTFQAHPAEDEAAVLWKWG